MKYQISLFLKIENQEIQRKINFKLHSSSNKKRIRSISYPSRKFSEKFFSKTSIEFFASWFSQFSRNSFAQLKSNITMNRHQVEIFHLLLLSSTNSSLNWDKKRAWFRGGKRWKKESSRFKKERATQKRELGRVYAIRHIRIITTTGMPVDCGMLCANASRHLHHFYQIQLFLEFFFSPLRFVHDGESFHFTQKLWEEWNWNFEIE